MIERLHGNCLIFLIIMVHGIRHCEGDTARDAYVCTHYQQCLNYTEAGEGAQCLYHMQDHDCHNLQTQRGGKFKTSVYYFLQHGCTDKIISMAKRVKFQSYK